jgi:hypothetical protein
VKAAIVVGDLSAASYVSVLVPGMYMSVGEQIEQWADVAQELHDQQTAFLRVFPRHNSSDPPSSDPPGVAAVAWIGYQTPVLMNIGGVELARQGADSLERVLQGIRTLREGDQPYLSVLAHSYGSTAALLALERRTVTVDALALIGSPGSAAQSVADLSVAKGNVYVGEAVLDPIVDSAFFGSDPGSPSYGAKPMGVGGTVDPITNRRLAGSRGHNEYFVAGTESMRNLALIGIDQGGAVSSGRSGEPRPTSVPNPEADTSAPGADPPVRIPETGLVGFLAAHIHRPLDRRRTSTPSGRRSVGVTLELESSTGELRGKTHIAHE